LEDIDCLAENIGAQVLDNGVPNQQIDL